MIAKINLYRQILANMGWAYVGFRIGYAIRGKLGILKRQFPVKPKQQDWIELENWKKQPAKFFFQSKKQIQAVKNRDENLHKRFEDFKTGKLWYFNAVQYNIGTNYDWLTNPSNQYRYDINKHWSEVADLSAAAGDIKYVWEKSRFSYLFDLIRYDFHFDQDCSALIFGEIESWIKANPINQGPNYKCSQEISLRILNWTFALYYYRDSPELTEERFQRLMHFIYWQLRHVYSNINFSRKTVRNNHAIAECLMLYLGGLLFPFFPEAQKWKTQGKVWFEQEIAYQVYEDGTFLQFSHNYHRVLLQLLTYAFYLSDANGESFAPVVYERAKKTLDYLFQCQAGKNGELPNYGANDGALFFRFNNADYSDYRPQINALYYFFTKNHWYPEQAREDVTWLSNNAEFSHQDIGFKLVKRETSRFPNGGIFLINDADSLTFIKCAGYKDRPSQADNLHLDLWVQGENVLRDSGTYRYNTDPELIRYFAGSKGHNTVMLDDYDQMQKGPRFIWLHWNQVEQAEIMEQPDAYLFQGTVKSFGQIGPNVTHRRTVKKIKGRHVWEVSDLIGQTPQNTDMEMVQYWHPNPQAHIQLCFNATHSEKQHLTTNTENAWYSGYYGVKTIAPIVFFKTKTKLIQTVIATQNG
jgi:Heparinase II/III-like protein/Heparinase II/III N-terminus